MQQPDSVQLPKIEDFYDLSYESGEIHLRGVRGRAFILPTKAWAMLRMLLSPKFKDDAIPFMWSRLRNSRENQRSCSRFFYR